MTTSVREYAILYVGGKGRAGGGSAAGGNVLLNAGQHALDGPEHTGQLPADRVSYDPTASGLVATDAQAAIDEEAAAIAALASLALDDLSDVVITAPTANQRLRYTGSSWVNSGLRWEPAVDYTGSVMLDSAGNPIMHEVTA